MEDHNAAAGIHQNPLLTWKDTSSDEPLKERQKIFSLRQSLDGLFLQYNFCLGKLHPKNVLLQLEI